MYTVEEFDYAKTKTLQYILYKKRTEHEVKIKFNNIFKEGILEEVISYLKESGYINDIEYIEKAVRDFILLKTLSIKEIKYKLEKRGLDRNDIDEYIDKHYDELCEYEKRSAQKLMLKKKDDMHRRQAICYLKQKGYKEEDLESI